MRYGSCNSKIFSVHPNASGFSIVGTPLTTAPYDIKPFSWPGSSTHIQLMRAQLEGQHWGWRYEGPAQKPTVLVCRNASNAVVYLWEAESIVDEKRPGYQAMQSTDERNASIVPAGGSIVTMDPLDVTGLGAIEALVDAAALPAWISDTVVEGSASSSDLLEYIFRAEQKRAGLEVFGSIADVSLRDISQSDALLYQMLWMRTASRILHNHYGQTFLPLALAHLTVDEYGTVTVI